MKKRHRLNAWLLAASCATPALAQAESWLDDTYISPMFSYSLADHDRPTDNGLGGTLGAGWRLSKGAEVELVGTYLKYKGDGGSHPCGLLNLAQCDNESQKVSGGGIGTNLFFGLFGSDAFGGPFLHLDVMATSDKAVYHAGPGWDFAFGEQGWALRAEALVQGDSHGDYIDKVFNIGLRIPLGPHRAPFMPPQLPEPVKIVAAPPPPPPPPPPPCELPAPGDAVDFSGCKTGDTIVLRGVNFEFDKWDLTPDAKALLDQVADALAKRPDIKVEVDGHTDSKGSDSYNIKLSDRRAKSVMDYLLGKGIAPERLGAKGFGEAVPIADNKTDEGRALNRRVELKVLEANAPVTVEQAGKSAEVYGATAPAAAPASAAPAAEAAPAPAAEPAAGAAAALPPTEAPAAHGDMTMPMPSAAAAPAAAATPGTVSIENFAFSPGSITVAVGTTVTFVNNDGSNHIVKFADGQTSPRLAMGKSWSRSFTAPGEYPYVCAIHSSMSGKIVVE